MSFSPPPPAEDATCLITGCSSGIGAAIARELAGRGYNVTLTARRIGPLTELATEIERAHGVRATAVACDINDEQARADLLAGIADRGERIDVLVNNAGIGMSGRLQNIAQDEAQRMIDTNVRSLVALTHPVSRAMVARGSGAILNVASTAAFQPSPSESLYTGSKVFVLSFSEALHMELKRAGVGCTVLCPGLTHTEFHATANLTESWGNTPEFLWMSADEVALAGVKGLLGGKRRVIPGLVNKVSAVAGQATPRPLLLRLLSRNFLLKKYPDGDIADPAPAADGAGTEFPVPRADGTVLVTGAASGIGSEIARRLAQVGYNLTLTDRATELLADLADELRRSYGHDVREVACDLRDDASRAELVEQAHSDGREIDILVNCAGLGGAGPFTDRALADELEMIDCNVKALVSLTRHVLPEMLARGNGAILNVASGAAFQPMPRFAVYAASKAFVLYFSESLSADLAGSGISCTTLCPGPTHTRFTDVAGLKSAESSTPDVFWKTPDEVAGNAVSAMFRRKRIAIPSRIYRLASIAGAKGPRGVTLFALDRAWPAADIERA